MLNLAGFVYHILENNPIHPNTIIENKTMDRSGVSITHISMGKDTSMSPERFNTIALYSVEKGKLNIEVRGEARLNIELNPGQFWLRPAHALVGFSALDDTVFTQMVLHRSSEISRELLDQEVCRVSDLLDYDREKPQSLTLIKDKWMKLELWSIAPGQNARFEADPRQITVIGVLYGNGGILFRDRSEKIARNETFGIEPNEHVRLVSANGMKVLVTTMAE